MVQFWLDVMNPDKDRSADGHAWYPAAGDLITEANAGTERVWSRGLTPTSVGERNIVFVHAKGSGVIAAGEGRLLEDNRVAYRWIAPLSQALVEDPIEYRQIQAVSHGPLVANAAKSQPAILQWLADHPGLLEDMGDLELDPAEAEMLVVERRRRSADLIERDQQEVFRHAVLGRDQRCVISGVATPASLEAAHITGVGGADSGDGFSIGGPDTLDNGLTLRADLHRLFDRGLLVIDEAMRVRVAPEVRAADPSYDEFEGKLLQTGAGVQPHPARLRAHRLAAAWFSLD